MEPALGMDGGHLSLQQAVEALRGNPALDVRIARLFCVYRIDPAQRGSAIECRQNRNVIRGFRPSPDLPQDTRIVVVRNQIAGCPDVIKAPSPI